LSNPLFALIEKYLASTSLPWASWRMDETYIKVKGVWFVAPKARHGRGKALL
jgi:transposase-like protein